MGSFNTACILSGISMGGDQAVFVPLVRSRFGKGREPDMNGQSAIVSNEGACAFYVALALPILGRMIDHGCLDTVHRDANTTAIERRFKLPILEFVRKAARGELRVDGYDINRKPIQEQVGGCFVHRGIWDKFSTSATDEWGGDHYSLWNSTAAMYPVTLRMMGFEFKGTSRRERYNQKWVHPSFPKVVAWSDGRWCNLERADTKTEITSPRGDLYSPREIARALVEHGGGRRSFPPAARKKLRETPTYQATLEDEIPQIIEQREYFGRHTAERPYYSYLESGRMLGYGLDAGFVDGFWPEIVDGTLHSGLVAWWTFLSNMYACNRLLLPGFNGYQCGNHHAHQELMTLTSDILRHKISRSRAQARRWKLPRRTRR